jgi:glutathione-regulated potassium-efflux system ancillary protein KefC
MGLPPAQATAITQRFRTHNIALADRMYPHYKDRAKFIAVAREGRNQFAEQMARERQESAALGGESGAYPGYGGVADGDDGDTTASSRELEKKGL